MNSQRIPKGFHRPQPSSRLNQPDARPLPTQHDSLLQLQGIIGNQAVQRLLIQRQVELEEMEIPVEGDSSGPVVMDEMEVPVDGGGGPVVMDEMEVPVGGSASGSGDSIVLPEDKITPGSGSSVGPVVGPDNMPGVGPTVQPDNIALPEDKVTPGSGEQEGGWLNNMWDTLTDW